MYAEQLYSVAVFVLAHFGELYSVREDFAAAIRIFVCDAERFFYVEERFSAAVCYRKVVKVKLRVAGRGVKLRRALYVGSKRYAAAACKRRCKLFPRACFLSLRRIRKRRRQQ